MLVEIVAGLSILYFIWFLYENQREANQPPGPLKIPGVGNMLQIIKAHPTHSHVAFDKLSKIYGPIMSLKLGWRQVVVLTSYEDMKELLSRDEFSGRVNDSYLHERAFGKKLGIIFSNGTTWDVMRKFTVRTLRDYGFSKFSYMESFLQTEVEHLFSLVDKQIEENDGKVPMERFFHLSVLNTIWSMILGERYEFDNKRLQDLIALNEEAFLNGSFGASLSFAFPPLRNIPPFTQLFGHDVILHLFDSLHKFMRDIIVERRELGEYKSNPQNFVDRYLCEMDKEEKTLSNSDSKEPMFTDEQFIVVCMDIFQAGSETTSATINYSILWLCLHPDVQQKVYEEIEKVVPQDRMPVLEDEILMDYTRATIQEIQRISPVVPLIPPRKVTKDYSYNGFHFKKDMAILVNMYSVFMDEDYWKDPTTFKPERFLDIDGIYKPDERLAYFGFGKRICLGDVLAKSNLFLILTCLLRAYKFECIPGEPKPDTFPFVGFTLRPKPFTVLVKRRKANV